MTEFKSSKTGQKVYLCAIIDLYDNSIVAHTFSSKNNNKLTVGTLRKALESNPGVQPLVHVDRGANFTSLEYINLVLDNNLTIRG